MEIIYGPDEVDYERITLLQRIELFLRSQIIKILYFTWGFLVFTVPTTIILVFLLPPFWPLGISYYIWLYCDRNTPYTGGRVVEWLRNCSIWKLGKNYHPIRLVKTAELPADRNYLFGAFPHGVVCIGPFANFATNANNFDAAFPGLKPRVVMVDILLFYPYFRDLIVSSGGCGATEESMMHVLQGEEGSVCVLMIGGVPESMKSVPGTYEIYLTDRKGFIKLALKTGVSLVPVFSFGETDAYFQGYGAIYSFFQSILRYFTGFPFLFIQGRGYFQRIFGVFPQRRPITTVVGKAINVPKMENPSEDDVDKYHSLFTCDLMELFENYKIKFDRRGQEAELIIW